MRVNISPIGSKNIIGIKNNNKIHYSTNPNLKLKSDIFIKSAQPSFKGNMSYTERKELERNFKTYIFTRNSEKLLECYEQNPEVIEQALWFPQELKTFEDRNIDKIFGFDDIETKSGDFWLDGSGNSYNDGTWLKSTVNETNKSNTSGILVKVNGINLLMNR